MVASGRKHATMCHFEIFTTQAECCGQEQSVRQQRPAALQRQGRVRLSGRGLHGLLLPLPRVRIAQMWRWVPLRQEVALRAGGGGRRRNHSEQVCRLETFGFRSRLFVKAGSFSSSWNLVSGFRTLKVCKIDIHFLHFWSILWFFTFLLLICFTDAH